MQTAIFMEHPCWLHLENYKIFEYHLVLLMLSFFFSKFVGLKNAPALRTASTAEIFELSFVFGTSLDI